MVHDTLALNVLHRTGSSASEPNQVQLNPTAIRVPLTATVPQAALAATCISSVEIGSLYLRQTIGSGMSFKAAKTGPVLNLMATGPRQMT